MRLGAAAVAERGVNLADPKEEARTLSPVRRGRVLVGGNLVGFHHTVKGRLRNVEMTNDRLRIYHRLTLLAHSLILPQVAAVLISCATNDTIGTSDTMKLGQRIVREITCSRCGGDYPADDFKVPMVYIPNQFKWVNNCSKCRAELEVEGQRERVEQRSEIERTLAVFAQMGRELTDEEKKDRTRLRSRLASLRRRDGIRAEKPTKKRIAACRPPIRIDPVLIAERDGWKCHICGKTIIRKDLTLDHLIPYSEGGEDTSLNLRAAHRSCNSRRGPGRSPAQLLLGKEIWKVEF